MNGCKIKSCKYCANLFHLNHSRESRIKEENEAKKQMQVNQEKINLFVKMGL